MSDTSFIIAGIPFYSQIIKPASQRGISEHQSRHWSERSCGIACVKMVLDGRRGGDGPGPSLWSLLCDAVNDAAYCERGWIHAGLIRLLGRYGLSARPHRALQCDALAEIIREGNPCIASVAVGFESSGGQGGHLVVVNGIGLKEGGVSAVRCHHPSSALSWNWSDRWVEREVFLRSFSGNAIEVVYS